MTPHAVVTPHHLSADSGRRVLEAGGNSVDAAVAAIATQGVVAPETCGVGGDLFALVHKPGWDRPKALNSSGPAGSTVNAETLRNDGLSEIPRDHPATVTVPGCIDGLEALTQELGVLSLAENLAPAIGYARDGFEVSAEQARAFALMADFYSDNPAVAEFYPEGSPVTRGARIRRPNLAATLRAVADGGREAFYQGQPGTDIVEVLGGSITTDDLASSCASWIDPIGCQVAGLTAWTTPPNSQGYLAPATLAVFEMLEAPTDPDHPNWWHLLLEAFRSLAWERNDVVADPENAPLPNGLLLDRERLERAARSVDREHTGVWPADLGAASGTAYLCVVDADGMTVSMIQSNYRGTGSFFGAPNSGFLLQDRGGGFSLMPGHPNELAPGKRPLHTLAPTLWTDDDRPRWVMGTRGGSVQPQLVAQVAARAVIAGADLEEAQAAPRWIIQEFGPNSAPRVRVEPGVAPGTLKVLRSRGHLIEELEDRQPGWGPFSIIEVDGDERRAAADPRVETTTALLFP